MPLTVGTPIDSTITMQAFLDEVYSNRTAALTSASAIFTPLDLNRLVVSWPGYDDVIYITTAARATPSEVILYQ